jgi:hypothetical protein
MEGIMTDNDVLEIRDQLWDVHPVIREKAILPTPALKNVISLVWSLARKARGSIASLRARFPAKVRVQKFSEAKCSERILDVAS